MPENYSDPAGNTEAFRAFANTPEPPAPAAGRAPLLVGAVVAAVVLVVLAAWLALG
ncbi:hypothetical protein AB0873_06505 [Micromonospora sp. NPDC047707]|uniref:hypothetical protein n=1 Tax=unclassified Micromonospora TaxID=2617518 RepID=UPI0018AFD4FE|nr:hypothetical protein [Micromonospora sp. WMMC415]